MSNTTDNPTERAKESDFSDPSDSHQPALDLESYGSAHRFIPDWLVDQVLEYVNRNADFEYVDGYTDFESLIENVQTDVDAEEVARVCVASYLERTCSTPEDYVAKAESGIWEGPESLALHSLPFALHKTESFQSATPGYCGPIWVQQFDSGPRGVVNVTRSKNKEGKTGYMIHTLALFDPASE